MQIIKPFSQLQWPSNNLYDYIEKKAKLLQKNNKKESKIAYLAYLDFHNYYLQEVTRDEIAYMVFHAIDKFNYEHRTKGDPLAHIDLKIEGNSIVIINNDYKNSKDGLNENVYEKFEYETKTKYVKLEVSEIQDRDKIIIIIHKYENNKWRETQEIVI